MIITMILIFVFGYLCIALEHKLRIDKAAIALLMCGALWTVLSLLGNDAQIGTQLIEQLAFETHRGFRIVQRGATDDEGVFGARAQGVDFCRVQIDVEGGQRAGNARQQAGPVAGDD